MKKEGAVAVASERKRGRWMGCVVGLWLQGWIFMNAPSRVL